MNISFFQRCFYNTLSVMYSEQQSPGTRNKAKKGLQALHVNHAISIIIIASQLAHLNSSCMLVVFLCLIQKSCISSSIRAQDTVC